MNEGHKTRLRRPVGLILLTLLPCLTASVICDRMLGLFGYPSEVRSNVAHPRNYHEDRHNLEYNYSFTTNSQGLRYRDLPLAKPPNERRVIVVGDSFTEGQGVEADDTFAAILERRFGQGTRPVNFINAGLAGVGPLHYGRVFLQVGTKYMPDGLLIVMHANDVYDTPASATPEDLYPNDTEHRGIRRLLHAVWPHLYTRLYEVLFLNKTRLGPPKDFVGEVVSKARQLNIPEHTIADWKQNVPQVLVRATQRAEFNGFLLSVGLLHPHHFTDSLDIDRPEADAQWRAMAALLTEIVAAARRSGIEVGMVYTPTALQTDPKYGRCDGARLCPSRGVLIRKEWLNQTTEVENRLHRWSEGLRVPFLDLTDPIRQDISSGAQLYYPIDGHWNPAGHRFAAARIARWMVEHKLFGVID